MLVKDLLALNTLKPITAQPDTYIREASKSMAEFGIGLLLVLDGSGDVAGVLSERDIIKALGTSQTIIDYALVGDLMTDEVVTVSPEDSLLHAVRAMGNHNIRHLVALEDGRPVGILSIRDVLKVFAQDLLDNQGGADTAATMDLVKALAA